MMTAIFNSILTRNIINGNKIKILDQTNKLNGDKIENPYLRNAPGLVSFLFVLHRKRGWQPKRKWHSYLREAKSIIDENGIDKVEKALLKAAHVSKHPFGFCFVSKFLED